jgi:hypothetical protein
MTLLCFPPRRAALLLALAGLCFSEAGVAAPARAGSGHTSASTSRAPTQRRAATTPSRGTRKAARAPAVKPVPQPEPEATPADVPGARPAASATEAKVAPAAAPAATSVIKTEEAEKGVKTYTFGAEEVEGRLKSPQILYFLRRVRAEFDAEPLGHRSFLLELSDTRRGL